MMGECFLYGLRSVNLVIVDGEDGKRVGKTVEVPFRNSTCATYCWIFCQTN